MKKFVTETWPELLFFAFILSVWLVWAFILPFNEGPDESMRSRIVEYIIEYGKLLFLEWGNDQRSNMVTVQITL